MAGNRVVVQEGYEIPFAGFDGYKRRRRSRRHGRRSGGRGKLARAAKHCKGRPGAKFRACIKAYFKRH